METLGEALGGESRGETREREWVVRKEYLHKLRMMKASSSELANNIMESLILAQNERWRRVLSMQVER